jgi:hypothetical protein
MLSPSNSHCIIQYKEKKNIILDVSVCLFGCLVVWLFGCLVVWLFGCLVVWLFGCLFLKINNIIETI